MFLNNYFTQKILLSLDMKSTIIKLIALYNLFYLMSLQKDVFLDKIIVSF